MDQESTRERDGDRDRARVDVVDLVQMQSVSSKTQTVQPIPRVARRLSDACSCVPQAFSINTNASARTLLVTSQVNVDGAWNTFDFVLVTFSYMEPLRRLVWKNPKGFAAVLPCSSCAGLRDLVDGDLPPWVRDCERCCLRCG